MSRMRSPTKSSDGSEAATRKSAGLAVERAVVRRASLGTRLAVSGFRDERDLLSSSVPSQAIFNAAERQPCGQECT